MDNQQSWLDSWQEQEKLFLSEASRLALQPTQPHIQWLPRTPSLGVKWLCGEGDHSGALVMNK